MAVCVQFRVQDPGFNRGGFLKSRRGGPNTSECMDIKLEEIILKLNKLGIFSVICSIFRALIRSTMYE